MTVTPPGAGAEDSSLRTSYGQILRSSALIGGAAALTLAIGIVRTKALAVLLGPAGIGLLGVYGSVADLVRSLAQLGINASGVRQIAHAVGTNDGHRIARTVTVLRRIAILLGLIGMAALVGLSKEASEWAFGNEHHDASIAWLSLAVFFRLVADGQAAMLQGMRRISELAKIGALGALAGAGTSIALAVALGEAGVVPGLVAAAGVSTLVSWRYARTVRVEPVRMSAPEFRNEAALLLKLGLAFMASALLTTGAAFAVRTLVLRNSGVDAAGLYQAAWTLGGMYVGLVLQAMGTDFYPRLVGVIDNPARANRMVNEQAQVSLLLAGPGVVATLVFASPVISVFFSAEFTAAVDTLRWLCLGMALRVITWPLGYIIVAKNRQVIFFVVEIAWTLVNLLLSVFLIERAGLEGAGIAFFLSYVFHALLLYPTVRHLNGFSWSGSNIVLGIVFVGSVGLTFVGLRVLPSALALAVGSVMCIGATICSTYALLMLIGEDELPAWLRKCRRALQRHRSRRTGQGNSFAGIEDSQ